MKFCAVWVAVMMLVLTAAGCGNTGAASGDATVQSAGGAGTVQNAGGAGNGSTQSADGAGGAGDAGTGDGSVQSADGTGNGSGSAQGAGDTGDAGVGAGTLAGADGTGNGTGSVQSEGDEGGAGTGDGTEPGADSTGNGSGTAQNAAGVPDEPVTASRDMNVEAWIMTHSLEEKVAQMFIVTPESIGGSSSSVTAGPEMEQGIVKYPVGAFIYFGHNLQSQLQTSLMLEMTRGYYTSHGLIPPFLSVDEEGGTVARIAGNPSFGIANVGPMINVGNTGDVSVAAYTGTYLSSYLKGFGFNMDMAPVADVFTNPANTVIGNRAFGGDPHLVAEMVVAEMTSMRDGGVMPVIKHFPGHGATEADSHYGYASVSSTLDELISCELIPFASAIDSGCQCIMVGHISAPNVTGNDEPATLSPYMMTTVLRNRLGFRGLIITDAMNMGAITNVYDSATAAVLSIKAGADIILMPVDFAEAYSGVLQAVNNGTISEDRIDESVRRILNAKKEYVWP